MNRIPTLLFCVLLASCAGTDSTKTLTKLDNDREVPMKAGQILIVELSSNRTTGYSWQEIAAEDPVLTLMGKPGYINDPHPPGMDGVGGKEVWRFQALKAGRQTLRLQYARPWEKDTPPADTVAYHIVVRE